MVLALGVLEPHPLLVWLGHVLHSWRCMVIAGSWSCRHPPWPQKVQIKLHWAAQVVIGALHKLQLIKISHMQHGIT